MLDQLPSWLLRLVVFLAERFERLGAFINAKLIDAAVNVSRNRPHPWSTSHDYTTWTGLSDYQWSARHLPPATISDLPSPDKVKELFSRNGEPQQLCAKSTCLFPAFAQYLTDGFIRTRMPSSGETEQLRRQNTSNHQIDLCPLYGRTQGQTDVLRLKSEQRGARGRLNSQQIKGEEYAPFLYQSDGTLDPGFESLDPPLGLDKFKDPAARSIFAFGGDRTNSVPQVAMINTLLLREHNRLAGAIEGANPGWDDERVFQTARNTLIAIFIKIVVEEYINHIAPTPFRLRADAAVGYRARWNRTNWITTEFSLLYRWHSLIPDRVKWNGQLHDVHTTFMQNQFLLTGGLLEAFSNFGSETAGRLSAANTAKALLDIEIASVNQGRVCELAPYWKYREYVGLKRPESFDEISSNPRISNLLKDLYGRPDRVEFYTGLFCEDTVANSPLPPLILKFVAVDAFSQALTNPLLSEHVFHAGTFSDVGWKAIQTTKSLADLLERNVPGGLRGERVSMTRPGWKYAW
jgi:prostaglandin-endoperoxide synthase 2